MTIRRFVLAVLLGAAVVGCGSAASASRPAGPAASQAPIPTAAPTTSAPASTAEPTSSSPVPTAAPTSPAAACAVEPQTGLLPSDRLTDVQVLGLPGRDVVQFTFGEGSLDPVGPSTGSLDVAVPPFTGGSSGLPIDVKGEHVLQVVFKGMSLQNDVGQPVFDGPREIEATDPARSLRHVVLFDEFEGQSGWYVGYDGPSCVTLSREGKTIVLAIDFAPGS